MVRGRQKLSLHLPQRRARILPFNESPGWETGKEVT